jgi:hypothetical protein
MRVDSLIVGGGKYKDHLTQRILPISCFAGATGLGFVELVSSQP